MSFYKDWVIKNSGADTQSAQSSSERVLSILLKNRGIDTPIKAEKFLNPLSVQLLPPDVFTDMKKAVQRVRQAAESGSHITVYGDFDADGITASAILYMTLKELGISADYYLPDRDSESHGLNNKALVQIISKRRTKLIITVDCGISNVQEVKFAHSLGADIIITDHHEAPEILPDAYAILNPKAKGALDDSLSIEDIQSLNYLAGAGAALKFAYALLEEFGRTDFAQSLLPAAAIGTIGDITELIGENRTIAAAGIELIKNGCCKGIQTLLKNAGIKDVSKINSETIAFAAVPRLNAAGRLESADTAIKIFVSDDDAVLNETSEKLNSLNSMRQNMCAETFEQADEMYKKDICMRRRGIVLYKPDWHIGIIGIAASKLIEKYNKPVFLLAADTHNPSILRCSARSIQGIDIHSVLSANKDMLAGFGGHKMAAGCSIDTEKVSFEKFKAALLDTIDEVSENIDFSRVSVYADMKLEPEDITEETLNVIEKLQPFGSGNPAPLFVMENTVLQDFRMMGQNAEHLKFNVSKNGNRLECIKWNEPDFCVPQGAELNLLFSMRLNTFNNITSIQLMIDDIHSEAAQSGIDLSSISFLDHRKKKNIQEKAVDYVLSSKRTSAVYAENPVLIKRLNLDETIKDKLFSLDNIPEHIQQIMFFEAPPSREDFEKIIKTARPDIVHLMDFGVEEITAGPMLIKLSGMLKYAVSNLKGIVNIRRAAKALCVNSETAECALALLEDSGMIDLNKTDENNYEVLNIHASDFSKITASGIFEDLENHLEHINKFRNFYLKSAPDKIKEAVYAG